MGLSIAEAGFVLVTGGRAGVMHAASEGAKSVESLTVGISSDGKTGVSEYVDVAIFTEVGQRGTTLLS